VRTQTMVAVRPVPRSRVMRLGEAPIQPMRVTCARCGCWHALLLLHPTQRGSGICPRCSWGVEHSDERDVET
jgi:hypothetical protein